MPLDRRPCLAGPRRPVRRLGLQDPLADQRLESLERLPCGWLVHRVAPPSDCSRNLISTRYPHVIGLVWHHPSLHPLSLYGSETLYCAASCMRLPMVDGVSYTWRVCQLHHPAAFVLGSSPVVSAH